MTNLEKFLAGFKFRIIADESIYAVYQFVNVKNGEPYIKNVKINSMVCQCEFEENMPNGVFIISEVLLTETRGFLSFNKIQFIEP